MKKYLDLTNILVIALTIILFVVALFLKGFTHDLLLEIGVLLVSIKIIMSSYKITLLNKELLDKLSNIEKSLSKEEKTNS